MLTPDAETQQSCRKSLKRWDHLQQLEDCRRARGCVAHGRADDIPMNGALDGLDRANGQYASSTHLVEQWIRIGSDTQRSSKNVRSGDSVLDGEVDADAAHW